MECIDSYDHKDPDVIYTSESIPTKDMEEKFSEQFSIGCKCKEVCTTENMCECILKSGAYYINPTFGKQNNHETYIINKINEQKPVYECNINCKCSIPLCQNRLVQFGPRKDLQIFSCVLAKLGLGLLTTKAIKKGNFICEYAGEIITKGEALKRHKINKNCALMNYIFCVNEVFGENNIQTFIDPSKFGNIGRYINHSCQPNCEIIPIRVNTIIPRLCIFANQDISENTELTFEYGIDSLEYIEPNSEITRIKCLCGSQRCRKYMPFSGYAP